MKTEIINNVTPEDIELVKSSWSHVIIYKEKVGPLFYSKLFELAPQVKPLFKTEISEQSKKLTGMITVVVTKLDKLDEILPEVQALAIRHKKYGTEAMHFNVVGQALIWTLEQTMESKWNDKMRDAWVRVYTLLSTAMIHAMED